MTARADRWTTVAGSVIGSVHVRDRLPRQDAVGVWSDADHAVAAVADGHGHHLHFRSDDGARIAVECAVAVVREHLADLADPATARSRVEAVGAEIVGRWQVAVAEHLAAHPFSDAEELEAAASSDPVRAYGTTLLVSATSAAVAAFWQVGDGDTVVVFADGEVARPLPEDPDLDGVRTSSLCQPDPLAALRATAVDLDEHEVVLAYQCSDGFGKPRVDPDWSTQTGADLLRFARTRGLDWIAEQVPEWLEEPARVGGDDVSLVLIARSDLAGPAGQDGRDRPPAPPTVPTPVVDPTA